MKLMFLLRLGIFFAFLTLIYLSQRFWFVGTWHWIGAIQRSNLRNGLQILWFVGLLTVLAGFLDPMLGTRFPKLPAESRSPPLRGFGWWPRFSDSLL